VNDRAELERRIELLDRRIAEHKRRFPTLRGAQRRQSESLLLSLESMRKDYADQLAGTAMANAQGGNEVSSGRVVRLYRWWVDDPTTGQRILTAERISEESARRQFPVDSTRPHWPSLEFGWEPTVAAIDDTTLPSEQNNNQNGVTPARHGR
jgi:hypothetical protein